MGHAPPQKEDPAMPDPARQVSKSYAMLRRLGFGHQNSYIAIAAVAGQCALNLRNIGVEDVDWLEQVAQVAQGKVGPITPSNTDNPGSDYADGTSGRTGRTDEDRNPAPQG